jgi:hypothetical protein
LVDHTIAPSKFGERKSMELEVFLAGPISDVDEFSESIRDSTELIMPYCKRFGVFNLEARSIVGFGSVNRLIHEHVRRKPWVTLYSGNCNHHVIERLTETLLLPKFNDYAESCVGEVYVKKND